MKGDKALACLGSAIVLESGHSPGVPRREAGLQGMRIGCFQKTSRASPQPTPSIPFFNFSG